MNREMDGSKAGWVGEQSRNAVIVEKPLQARQGMGIDRWMGEEGTGQFERRSDQFSFPQ